MTKSKRKPAKRPAKKQPKKDFALIRECVIYAQSVAAQSAGFAADPTGNNDHASALADIYFKRAEAALLKIARTPATTVEGLQAKARIVPVMIDDNEGSIVPEEKAFFRSFAAEVKEFLADAVQEAFVKELNAKKASTVGEGGGD